MCGIFAFVGNSSQGAELVFEGLKKLEYRGYDSWGIGYKHKNKILTVKRIGGIGEAYLNFPPVAMAMGHTRWATHGGVNLVNAHPHLDCFSEIAIIHNGIIENYAFLKKKLEKKGHHFCSQTDSEVAVHLIEEYARQLPFREAFRRAFLELEGLNAVIAMEARSESFVASKNGSSLVVGFSPQGNFLASDAQALLSHTKEVYFLEDKELVETNKEGVRVFKNQTGEEGKIKREILTWKEESADLGNYPHFMIKEIMEQPKILKNLAQNVSSQIPDLTRVIKKAFGTYMIGCGTAGYAAMSGTYFFSRIARKHVNFAFGSEFGYALDFLTPNSLVIAFSQSGETIDIIESVAKAQKKKAKVLAIVNNLGSTLYRMSDYKMLLGAGPEKCVLSTKTFTAKLAMIILLSYGLNGGLSKGKKVLLRAASAVEKLFETKNLLHLKRLAGRLALAEHIYLVGRGQSYPISLEAALKIKEVSYIHAEGFAAGELKHGVIALIEKGIPCLIFAPCDETFGAALSGAMEMRSRGGFIVGISPKNHEVFDWHIKVDDCGEATVIPNIVVAQLLAYFLALKLKRDPDKPRNLAKSVTVK